MISSFNPFLNGDNKTIFKNLEQQFELIHTKLKPKSPHKYIQLCKHFGRGDEEADKNG